MDETYPILFDGVQTGTLTLARRGLLTEFTARCDDPGRLVRLSVYGGGREGYLGVMEPEDGKLTLCRRLSRGAMALFPEKIEYASEAGQTPPPAARAEAAHSSAQPGAGRNRSASAAYSAAGIRSEYIVHSPRPSREYSPKCT